jgi:hypothetical protein
MFGGRFEEVVMGGKDVVQLGCKYVLISIVTRCNNDASLLYLINYCRYSGGDVVHSGHLFG